MSDDYDNAEQPGKFIDVMLRAGSEAEYAYRTCAKEHARTRVMARSTAAAGQNDLVRHGGRIVPQSVFHNIYLGGTSLWTESDFGQIDEAITLAMQDRRLENVLRQYFPKTISCENGGLILPKWEATDVFLRRDVGGVLERLFANELAKEQDLDATLFNIILPKSVVLRLGKSSSLNGLGGFHGSTQIPIRGVLRNVYYSVNVYSDISPDGQVNGIAELGTAWKNTVAVLYHEINEFRTDPDVEKANAAATEQEQLGLIGWISHEGEEIGDHPLSGDFALGTVIREVLLADGERRVPVQLMYSNNVHGPQGPLDLPSDATRRSGHGIGLRGIEAAAANAVQEARFGLMFPGLAARGDVAPFPEDLGLSNGPMDGGLVHTDATTLFAVMTYFGQFVDHDITFDPTSSLERQQDPEAVRNFRTPALELDNLYGAGPAASPFLYDQGKPNKMLIGRASNDAAEVDVPRNSQGTAIIGDPRNDENLIVSQLHLAFLKFHNAVVDQLPDLDDGIGNDTPFEKAQRLVRWHYQWLILHEFLPAIVGPDMVKDVNDNGRKLFNPVSAFIPVEFSVAAYRFGHSMVQPGYGINDTFGSLLFPSDPGTPPTTPGQPRTDLRGGPLRFEERVNWKNFLDTGVPLSPKAKTRFASKIDTRLAGPLIVLPASVVPREVPPPLRSLAVRNLRRGVVLGLPSGQAVAETVKAASPDTRLLTDTELWADAPQFGGQPAPLWYYILREAAALAGGEHLGPVGGRIVCEVLFALLELDPSSYRTVSPGWKPIVRGRTDTTKFTFADFFHIAGVDVK
jgi:hypothetical protein